ncbi:hypothetical protein M752DRAFT_317652 [Aspergillus phoenicis ATCC 13157]|uniref:Phytanoyl-CoA dioxygenase n=1 Tax=Aspergillus phoenicis ATCC 13157 TaxID=1353007 RepID=A0A370PUH6_ASPPH|nr:hypothetical protein M752DRAFT_317652 [Aspergillus phoenicis ATCC 13157]
MYQFPLRIARRTPQLTPTSLLQTPIQKYYHDRKQSSHPHAIKPSKTELSNKQLTPQNLETAIHSLFHDGLVIVENAIPHDPLDQLNTKMIQDAYTLQARNENSPYNYNPGNIQQDPPPTREYFSKDIFLNPLAIQITSTALGPRSKWTFCSGNTAMPPTSTCLHLQEGAHGADRASGRIKVQELEKRRAVRMPCQPVVPKGSLVIRDLRLWHAGMGNRTGDVRVMLAMIHFAPWYRNRMRLELAEELRPMVERETGLEIPVDWVSEKEALARYLNRGFGNEYDFSQEP